MRILSQLFCLATITVLPVVLMLLLMWNVILQMVADALSGVVDQSAFIIALVSVMMSGTWLAGTVTGVLLYKQLEGIAEQRNY
jgi:hypothetical protein